MTTRKSTLPTLAMMRELIKAAPGWYLANVFLWTSIWVLPVIPALITRRFFDDLGTVGFNPATLIAALLGYGAARLAVMFTAMWNDVNFMFRISSTLRRNMIQRIFALPGAQSGKEASGEIISRFREDVEHVEEATSMT
ncbi:MAG: ABC transporter ATP-binding protein, partial [bacterium]|nr:ABC transporter ATP-binding protein [bacterium]